MVPDPPPSIARAPAAPLRPFVSQVWAGGGAPARPYPQPLREHLLPGGDMHLVFRLSDAPLHILDPDRGLRAQRLGIASVAGARSRYYVRELSAPSQSVGAVLRPGAAERLFGVPADVLAGRHTPLDALCGGWARQLHERLLEARNAEARLRTLEAALLERLPEPRGLDPAIAPVLRALPALPSVDAAVRLSGLSHRAFIARFRRTTGLGPKTCLRVLRFQQALRSMRGPRPRSLAELALEAGYSDQAHFSRDFLAFSGVTPLAYLRRAPAQANHLPVDGVPPGQFSSRTDPPRPR